MGPLAINQTSEILRLSGKDQKYVKNLNTLKVNDLNFDQFNKRVGSNRYIVQGDQVQLGLLDNLPFQKFYLQLDFLGSELPEFSVTSRELVAKDGLQLYRYKTNRWQ